MINSYRLQSIIECDLIEVIKQISNNEKINLNTVIEDVEWLIEQAKYLEWLKQAIGICNDQEISPKELAELLKNNKGE